MVESLRVSSQIFHHDTRHLLMKTGFADEHALILYVYLSNYDDGSDDSVLTASPFPIYLQN